MELVIDIAGICKIGSDVFVVKFKNCIPLIIK